MTITTSIRDRVDTAIRNHADLPQTKMGPDITPETFVTATPDRLSYALAWVVANEIVAHRFLSSGIDVIPVFHPENGWDRFVITRRFSGKAFGFQPANEFGMLMVTEDDGPHLTTPGGKVRLKLGQMLRDDPEAAIQAVLSNVPNPGFTKSADGKLTPREKPARYPEYYAVVVNMILDHPGLVVAREIYIDNEEIDGAYHPLYLHAVELTPDGERGQNLPRLSHNWFQLQYGELFAFLDRRGTRSIYRTDHNTWSLVKTQIVDEPAERISQRMRGWMRLDGRSPDPEVD
ncbi:MAG: hypothetical protein M9890_05885 [Thermomicrobiales bacterium]|nr:hypothetical protein [Thermomicrobiales bacterium]